MHMPPDLHYAPLFAATTQGLPFGFCVLNVTESRFWMNVKFMVHFFRHATHCLHCLCLHSDKLNQMHPHSLHAQKVQRDSTLAVLCSSAKPKHRLVPACNPWCSPPKRCPLAKQHKHAKTLTKHASKAKSKLQCHNQLSCPPGMHANTCTHVRVCPHPGACVRACLGVHTL